MIRPTVFGFNEEAFKTNSFQNRSTEEANVVHQRAVKEFDTFADGLRDGGVDVIVVNDLKESETPDSIFPNNWFSTHSDRTMFLYPMAVSNRRKERRSDIIDQLVSDYNYTSIDLSYYEGSDEPKYLEGTGSLIFDHDNKVVYAAISPRTNKTLVEKIANQLDYEPVLFTAYGKNSELIYHTNVMMAVGDRFIVVGLDTIDDNDRAVVLQKIKSSGKEVIELSNEQIYEAFAGNVLQLEGSEGQKVLAISKLAYDNLTEDQLQQYGKYIDIFVKADIPTIESVGGGSARCMIAELF